jgi:hypothetical protein
MKRLNRESRNRFEGSQSSQMIMRTCIASLADRHFHCQRGSFSTHSRRDASLAPLPSLPCQAEEDMDIFRSRFTTKTKSVDRPDGAGTRATCVKASSLHGSAHSCKRPTSQLVSSSVSGGRPEAHCCWFLPLSMRLSSASFSIERPHPAKPCMLTATRTQPPGRARHHNSYKFGFTRCIVELCALCPCRQQGEAAESSVRPRACMSNLHTDPTITADRYFRGADLQASVAHYASCRNTAMAAAASYRLHSAEIFGAALHLAPHGRRPSGRPPESAASAGPQILLFCSSHSYALRRQE